MPIFVANFVLMEYGTGAVMAVPTHDQRDFEFANKYDLERIVVIQPEGETLNPEGMSEAYLGDGIMVNSESFNGMHNRKAMDAITDHLEQAGRAGGRSTIASRTGASRGSATGETPSPLSIARPAARYPYPTNSSRSFCRVK